jgi:hypothetical protein
VFEEGQVLKLPKPLEIDSWKLFSGQHRRYKVRLVFSLLPENGSEPQSLDFGLGGTIVNKGGKLYLEHSGILYPLEYQESEVLKESRNLSGHKFTEPTKTTTITGVNLQESILPQHTFWAIHNLTPENVLEDKNAGKQIMVQVPALSQARKTPSFQAIKKIGEEIVFFDDNTNLDFQTRLVFDCDTRTLKLVRPNKEVIDGLDWNQVRIYRRMVAFRPSPYSLRPRDKFVLQDIANNQSLTLEVITSDNRGNLTVMDEQRNTDTIHVKADGSIAEFGPKANWYSNTYLIPE